MGGEFWIQEEHPGDERFRRAVQPGRMILPDRLTTGTPQAITFPSIGNPMPQPRRLH